MLSNSKMRNLTKLNTEKSRCCSFLVVYRMELIASKICRRWEIRARVSR